jgi:hypothetical protein
VLLVSKKSLGGRDAELAVLFDATKDIDTGIGIHPLISKARPLSSTIIFPYPY